MNLIQYLQEAGVDIAHAGQHHHARRGWAQMDCPTCGPNTKKYHLGFNMAGGYFNCYKCGKIPTAVAVAGLLGVAEHDAIRKIRQLEWKGDLTGKLTFGPTRPVNSKLILPKGLASLKPCHASYLKRRGFDPEEIERIWKVQGIMFAPPLSYRIFIPIFFGREMVSWTTRSIGSNPKLRYISANAEQEKIPHKTILYGEEHCRYACCVVEGPISAWAIGPGAVATCGVGYKHEQLVRLAKYPVIGICFDNEPIAQQRARKLADSLSAFGGKVYNIQLDAKDPAEAPRKQIIRVRKLLDL